MKTFNIFAVITALCLFLTTNVTAQDKAPKKTAEVTFSIDIDCPSCVKKLEAKLPFEAGVKDLKIDLPSKTVWFLYATDKTDKEKLAKALDKLGYPAKEVENKDKK